MKWTIFWSLEYLSLTVTFDLAFLTGTQDLRRWGGKTDFWHLTMWTQKWSFGGTGLPSLILSRYLLSLEKFDPWSLTLWPWSFRKYKTATFEGYKILRLGSKETDRVKQHLIYQQNPFLSKVSIIYSWKEYNMVGLCIFMKKKIIYFHKNDTESMWSVVRPYWILHIIIN